jgi:hypothetical protein
VTDPPLPDASWQLSQHPQPLAENIVTHLFSGDCRLVRARLPREAEVWFESDGQDHLTGDRFPELYAKNSRT